MARSHTLRTLVRRLGFPRHPTPPAAQRVVAAAAAFADTDADPLALLQGLVRALRPRGSERGAGAAYQALLDHLEANPQLALGLRRHLIHFLASRRLLTFFTDSGILPGTGFFSEWWRIIGHHLLPVVPDQRRLKDCLHVMYDHADDWRWMGTIAPEQSQRLWALVAAGGELGGSNLYPIIDQVLDAILLLAHRISGLGVDGELLRTTPDLDDFRPRFIALSAEALEFTRDVRAHLVDPGQAVDDGGQLLVIVDQCLDALAHIHRRAHQVGTSLHLTYLLTRGEQSLHRLEDLVAMLGALLLPQRQADAVNTWSDFVRRAVLAENRRNSLAHYWQRLSRLLALRVTENAAHSGEHYICEAPGEYAAMWRSAAGAGIFIAIMAWLKIQAAALHAPPLVEAFLFSMIYGLGFVAIYLLGLTVATKQPAMTAQTLAAYLSDLRPQRDADQERIADLAAAVTRSQVAAILGNVLVALPVAMAIAAGLGALAGEPAIALDKAAHLLHDLDPRGWAIPHAAIAGFYLFLSGLIAGYFDNRATYGDVGRRLGRLPWLRRALGPARAAVLGGHVQDHLGGIMGNFLFGCMLGSTGFFGLLLGLPLDIRHIAFSSANLGYALAGFGFDLPWSTLAWAAFGVAAIGGTNLGVSFLLALRTALKARRADIPEPGRIVGAIWRRLRARPRAFLLPERRP